MSRNVISDGILCADCLDTGWLENREEGRYACTCITEMEPYQLLQAKCSSLENSLEQTSQTLGKWIARRTELSNELKDADDAANAFYHKTIELDNKVSELEIALRIKGEEHKCCTEDLIGLEAKCAELETELKSYKQLEQSIERGCYQLHYWDTDRDTWYEVSLDKALGKKEKKT